MPFIPLHQGTAEPLRLRSGFIPLSEIGSDEPAPAPSGFIPLDEAAGDSDQPSVLRNVLLNNPGTAIAETAANLGSQMVALPAAGLAGIGVAAGRALGLTEADPADVVHRVGDALTYQPRGEMGKAATDAAMYPFQKLAEGGQWVGDKTLDATGSPVAATIVDTAINSLPMMIAPAAKGVKQITGRGAAETVESIASPSGAADRPAAARGFIPIEEFDNGATIPARAQRLAGNDQALHGTESTVLEGLWRQRNPDLPGMDGEFRSVPPGHGDGADPTALAWTAGRESGVLPRELRLDDARTADTAAAMQPERVYSWGTDALDGSGPAGRVESRYLAAPDREGIQSRVQSGQALSEFDLADAQRRDAPASRVGEADRRVAGDAVAEGGEARYALGNGLDAKQPSGFIPLRDVVDPSAHEAATSSRLNDLPQPTPAQIEAGNYRKGAVKLHGLDIAIENPKGSLRSGVSPEGKPWQAEMQHHYGYVRRTLGKDGDSVDVFIGPKPESRRVFVIDQINPATGKFDEHKVILGAESMPEAKAIYSANYEPGWKGAGAISEMPLKEFKQWVAAGERKNPVAIPSILGKRVTEYTDANLAKWQGSRLLSDKGRDIAAAEIERRAASADASPAAVQDMAAGVQNGTWNPGANYSPFVDQVRTPTIKAKTVSDLPDPIRRERIVGDLAKALDTTIYEGRVKGKRRLGFFRPGVDEVRIKRAADIEVAAHEVAHLIDKRVPALQQAWRTDKALATELKSVSYDQKNVKEGFAEAVRLWTTQPDVLEARAPRVHAWLNDFADSHKYGPALRKAQTDMTDWFGQDALNRARSKIGDPGKFGNSPVMRYLGDWWDKQKGQWRQSIVDDLDGIYRMERGMTGKLSPNGPYESARLSRASASIADGAVRFGYPVKNRDGSFSWKGRGLEDILKPVAESMDDALLYFVGRSANELMGQNREHLFTKGEIDGMLRLRTPEREKAFQDYQAWNKGILDFAEAQGIINPESRRLWQRTQYLPFHRVDQAGGLKGKPGEWSGIQALTGGTTNIKDVLGNMVGNAAMLLDKAVKNEARLKVARLSQMEGGGKFMVKIEPGERMVKIGGDQVLEALLKKYGIAIDGGAPAFFEFLIKGQPPAGKNVVAVMQGGKPIWFEVGDPLLYRALSAIDRPVQSEVVKWLGLPKRIGQASITAVPDFWLANIARDTIMGSVMSRAGFRPIIDSLDGMRMRMTSDPIYKEWVANGGGLSSIYLDEAKLRTKLEKFYGRQGIDYRTVLDAPGKLLNMIETLGDAFESSTRIGEYKRAVARGDNPRHAAYIARDVSTDFAMKGDSKALGFMYDTVMFLRPALVSWDRLYRGLAHDPNKGAIAAKAGTIALMSAGLYLLNRDDPRYADLPDWDRDSNWHFFIGDHHFRYPKIWEIGAMSSAAERSVEKIMAADPVGLGKDFARIIKQTFTLNLMPQIIAPLAEQAANRNSFTNAPIETPGMENVQPFLRAKPGTSETMKAAGMATRDLLESLQVNPARAEALLRGYFNTWALYGLMLSDQALFGDKLPERRADQMPVIRRFYANEPAQHTKYETVFYDLLQESKRMHGTLRELDHMGRPELADEKERSPLAGESKPLERAAKNLSIINKDMEQVRRSDATPAEKRQKLDALAVERNALLKGAVTDSQAAQAKWQEEVQAAEAALRKARKQ